MAVDYIELNGTLQEANELMEAIEFLLEGRTRLLKIKEKTDHWCESPSTYDYIETAFGLSAGLGDDMKNLIDGANSAMNTGDVDQMIERVKRAIS